VPGPRHMKAPFPFEAHPRQGACLSVLTLALAFIWLPACQPAQPQLGSQTNWIKACDTSEDCGLLECLCGTCTFRCSEEQECSEAGAGVCVPPTDAGAIALCDGTSPAEGMCLARCDDDACPSGTHCVAGVCRPTSAPDAHVIVDPDVQHQALVGFGASIAGTEVEIVGHTEATALYDTMFAESGFDIVRMSTRAGDEDAALPATARIISEATDRLGRAPLLLMTSGSPPAALKANGSRTCQNEDPLCTLARNAEGAFDYAGFAEYWRSSLEAYEALGIHPDLITIQNTVDWIPPDEEADEACRFLPEGGTAPVTTADGATIEAEFPSYVTALAAVQEAVATLGVPYSFAAPDVGSTVMVERYTNVLDAGAYDAIAFHPYGTTPENVDPPHLEGLRDLAVAAQKPLLQSEMEGDGLDTAILAHHFLTLTGASSYLQAVFVSPTLEAGALALISLDGDTFQTMPAYHALAHYARDTDPGWLRVDATNDSSALLSTAWLAPDGLGLTIVLVNPSDALLATQISLAAPLDALLDGALVTRTTFEGVERSAELGELGPDGIVRVPGHAVVTVAGRSQ